MKVDIRYLPHALSRTSIMTKIPLSQIVNSKKIPGWSTEEDDFENYEIGLEKASRHPGKNCAFIKSRSDDESDELARNAHGRLRQVCGVEDYKGHRIRMTAWLKTDLAKDAVGRLECMAIGKWGWYCKWNGTFDNMSDRQLTGSTDWSEYSLVIDVPEDSYSLYFGVIIFGVGKMWLDQVRLEIVDKEVPLTGLPARPINLDFTD